MRRPAAAVPTANRLQPAKQPVNSEADIPKPWLLGRKVCRSQLRNFMPELALQPFIKRLHGDLQQLGYIASDGRLLGKESMCLSGYAPLTDCL